MTRFLDEAIARAGLMPVLAARRAGDFETVRATVASWRGADLLAIGAVAELARIADVGDAVRIHAASASDVAWIEASSELALLREVAVARIANGGRIGVDWTRHGLELAQVALGFGASDLRGAITKKSGLPILATEGRRVKGEGVVDLASLRRREIARLVSCAGRKAVFVDDVRAHAHEEGAAHA
ncbi:MAG TPA: hypothetical protein VIF62_35080 [Labilithrix sp.]